MSIPIPGVEAGSGIEAERRRHVRQERTLKAIAALLMIWNASDALGSLITTLAYCTGRLPAEFEAQYSLPREVFGFLWALVLLWAAWRLWLLKGWGRLALIGWLPGLLIAVVSIRSVTSSVPADAPPGPLVGPMAVMLLFGVGIPAYLVYLGFAKKTRRVLSASYQQEVVAKTPRIENRLAGTTKVALVIMAIFSSVGIIFSVTMLLGF